MSELNQCPFEKACKCAMEEPCDGCETFAANYKCTGCTELTHARKEANDLRAERDYLRTIVYKE